MAKQRVIKGPDSLFEIRNMIKDRGIKKILLVTGKKSFESSSAKKLFEKFLDGYEYKIFNDFEANPKYDDLKRGLHIFSDYSPDLLIAIGGGTVIDMAKLINTFVCENGDPSLYLNGNKQIERIKVPLWAVPTTAGSGSEATKFAVVYKDNHKYSIENICLRPELVVLDPYLTMSMSPYLSACTAMDALCQGIESYWSVNSSEKSREYSRESIQITVKNIRGVVNTPNSVNREEMQNAAYLAGKAINIAKTTAAHAFSYHLTSKYNIPHGHAVGMVIGWVFNENVRRVHAHCTDSRGREYVQDTFEQLIELLGIENVNEIESYFYSLMDSIGLDIGRVSIDKKIKKELMQSVNLERLKNNPVEIV